MAAENVTIIESSKDLAQLAAVEPDSTRARRLICLRLYKVLSIKGESDPVPRVAAALRLSESAVRKWLIVYQHHGLEQFLRHGRPDAAPATTASIADDEAEQPSAETDTSLRINLDRIIGSVTDTTNALQAWKGTGPDPITTLRSDWPSREDLGIAASRSESDRPPVRRPASAPNATARIRDLEGTVEQEAENADGKDCSPGPESASLQADPGVETQDRAPQKSSARSGKVSRKDPQEEPALEGARRSTSLGGARILIADTDEMIRSVMRHRIERQGATVVEASDGMEVVGVAQATRFDLVVVSATLPGLDGFEVVSWLRDSSEGVYIPVMMTAWPGDASDMSRAFETGADDFLRKPFSPVEMIARLKRLLTKHKVHGGDGGPS